MNIERFNSINNLYKELCAKADTIRKSIKSEGYDCTYGFFNNHSIKIDKSFVTEYYPIPVISISNIGDIGIDIDNIWFEICLSKETAVSFNYSKILGLYKFEIYGAEDYLSDLYNEDVNPLDIIRNIELSKETKVCLIIYFNKDCDFANIIKVIHMFSN